MKKYTKMDVGKSLLVADFVVAFSSFFVFDLQTGLFSLLGLFAKAFEVDAIIDDINICKSYHIICRSVIYPVISYHIIPSSCSGMLI
jgi:uncharacterized membrane-anchored protein YitT (DUF2179 family)